MGRVLFLQLDKEGKVATANKLAKEQFGPCVGQACFDVVGATSPEGEPYCTATCARELAGSGGDAIQSVTIKGRPSMLTCSEMDGGVVVGIVESQVTPIARPLTKRETQVMKLIALGLTNRVIAKKLGIKMPTVRTHVEHILDKLKARSRAEAVSRALASGQISLF